MEFVIPSALRWLALVPLLLAAYALAQTRRDRNAVPISSVMLLRAAMNGRPSTAARRHLPPLLLLIGLGLGAVTIARPAVRTALPKERATIVLVIDVSGSMQDHDMFPSRLGAAQRASKAFVDQLPADFRVGLVAFSDTATLLQPVTEDHAAVRAAIDGLKVGGGTAIGDGMQVALAALPSEQAATLASAAPALPGQPGAPPPPPPGIVVLLTDGENGTGADPLDVAQKARDAKVPVFTVGMGSRGGPFGRSGGGIDEQLLREVAAQTGGQYYYAPNGGELHRIYSDLGLALGFDLQRLEIGQYFTAGALGATVAGLLLAFLWLHRQP